MLGFLHVIHVESGVRFGGELAKGLKFEDMPSGLFASCEAVPGMGWVQILAVCLACETGYAGTPWAVTAQEEGKAPGDIGGASWTRYPDANERALKLNMERNNGRAAMLGITGCLVHEILGVDALYPTGGWAGDAPREIIDCADSFAHFPALVIQ